MAKSLLRSLSLLPLSENSSSSSADITRPPSSASTIFGTQLKLDEIKLTHLRSAADFNRPALRLKALRDSAGATQEVMDDIKTSTAGSEHVPDPFSEMKQRFLSFKRHTYLKNIERFESLAESQAPKFMVIACADSRVCPSAILGFQPGDAFVIRNVANLVPPFENGPTETNAALEFAVNALEVENLLVVGHSRCGGIRALMSMENEANSSSFIRNWVVVGKHAKSRTKAAVSDLSFDQQCSHCEKESINRSLLNLLTYPWIQERVRKGLLSIHGGYYNFIDCTFEKWTLDYQETRSKEDQEKYSLKNREFWC